MDNPGHHLNLNQHLIQSQSQKLILTPQLKLYLKLLQLPILELNQAIEQELNENPLLEEKTAAETEDWETETAPPPAVESRELNFDDKLNALEKINQDFKDAIYASHESNSDETQEQEEKRQYQHNSLSKSQTLTEYIQWQLSFLNLTAEEQLIAGELIGNLEEDGYLLLNLDEFCQKTIYSPGAVEGTLAKLQTLDPPGIFARTLQECLAIQLKRKPLSPAVEIARKIVAEYFPLLEKKHFAEIARKMGLAQNDVIQAFQEISRLEPKPGQIFFATDPVSVIPDATVSVDDNTPDQFKIEIHDEHLPELRINQEYRRMLRDKTLDAAAREFLKQKMESALNLIRAISQRKSTLRLITEEIVNSQKDFFSKGFLFLNPLRLKDISSKISIHESTVSRAISGKYLSTPRGTIPYRSFFSSKMEMEDGSMESQKSIMEQIKDLIEQENKKKPLSDAKLVEILKTKGLVIARRTVAKYRDLLKILPTHLRKIR